MIVKDLTTAIRPGPFLLHFPEDNPFSYNPVAVKNGILVLTEELRL
jgi:hypothetical protein